MSNKKFSLKLLLKKVKLLNDNIVILIFFDIIIEYILKEEI